MFSWKPPSWRPDKIMIWPWSTKPRSREGIPIERLLRALERWWRICWPWIGGKGISCLQETTGARRPNPVRRRKHQNHTERRLPGPAICRLSDGDQTPEALFELFQDWQRTPTQSFVTVLNGPRQRMDVRFCEGRNQPPRGHTCGCGFWKLR